MTLTPISMSLLILAGLVWWKANKGITFRGYKDMDASVEGTNQERQNGQKEETGDPLLNGPFVTGITDPYKLTSLRAICCNPDSL